MGLGDTWRLSRALNQSIGMIAPRPHRYFRQGAYRALRTEGVPLMLGIGQRFPRFALTGVVSNDVRSAFQPFTQDSFAGKWKVLFFWPKDFTLVCPTEIAAFGKLNAEFSDRDAVIYGASIDSEFAHLAC